MVSVAGLAAFACIGQAFAQDETAPATVAAPAETNRAYTFTPRIDLTETITDNARGTTFNRRADLISTLAPGFNLTGQGNRTRLALDYSALYSKFANNTDQDGLTHQLTGTGSAELLRELAFVDLNASISEQIIDARREVSNSSNNINSNQAQVQTYRLSPFIKPRLGDFATTEFRYALGRTMSDSTGTLSDSTQHQINARIAAGPDFNRLTWDVATSYSITQRDSAAGGTSGDSKQSNLIGSGEYILTRDLSLLSSIGYERIDDASSTGNSTRGIIASGGFRWTPSPRTSLKIVGNHRFDANFVTVEGKHELTEQTKITISYDENVSTQQGRLLNNVANLGTATNGAFVNTGTGQLFEPRNSDLGVGNTGNSLSRQKIGTLVVTSANDIVNLSVRFRHEELTTDSPRTSQTTNGININGSKKLGPRTDLRLGFDYSNIDFGATTGTTGSETQDTFRATAGLSFELSETVTTSVTISSLLRQSNLDGRGLRENTAIFGIRKSF